jgi:hypothetical protein
VSDELKKRLQAVENQAHQDATKPKQEYPSGWQPGVVWEGKSGELTTPPREAPPTVGDWEEYMLRYGLDPEVHLIVDDKVRFTAWDGWKRDEPGEEAYSTVLHSFRATVMLRREYDTQDFEDLYREVKKAKKPRKKPADGEETLVVLLSDWQVGIAEAGGAEATVKALANLTEAIPQKISDMRNAGHKIGNVCLAGMGDLAENCYGFYPYQAFTVELDRRNQIKVVRRALRDIIMATAPMAPRVTVTAVGGNHGENRSPNAKTTITTKNDNDDVAVFEMVAEIVAQNKSAYGHVSFHLPDDRLAVALDLSGQVVAFTHGHIARGGKPIERIWNWWHNQAFGRHYEGVADADILCAGHFHHLNVRAQNGRVAIIAPALTKVGDYFADGAGVEIEPGTLVFTVGEYGWNSLSLIR